jgi:dienelactone hydrolase
MYPRNLCQLSLFLIRFSSSPSLWRRECDRQLDKIAVRQRLFNESTMSNPLVTFYRQQMGGEQSHLLSPLVLCLVAVTALIFHSVDGADQPSPESVHFSSGNVTLAASLFTPPGKTPHPGIVLIGGSGSAQRGDLNEYARHLCSLGFCALTYDKRGSGESTGDWTTSSLDDLADDAAAAIAYLKKLPQVDPNRVGVWGVSQAGWIIPVLSMRSLGLAFAIVLTGGGATPREVEMSSYEHALDEEKVSGEDRRDAEALLARYFEWLKTGVDRTGLIAAIEEARPKSWYSVIALDQILPSERFRPKWQWVATFDPLPLIKKMQMPVIVVLGEKDHLLPVELSAQRWREGLAAAGNTHAFVKILSGANHAGRLGEMHSGDSPISSEYFRVVGDFLTRDIASH